VQISSAEIAGNERAQLDKLAPRIVGQSRGSIPLRAASLRGGKSRSCEGGLCRAGPHKELRNIRNIAYSHQIVPCPHRQWIGVVES
jgi:hypothetical protein